MGCAAYALYPSDAFRKITQTQKREVTMFYIGCHLSVTGGYAEMGRRALTVGATTFQFFTKNPRGRSSGSFPSSEDTSELIKILNENGMHAPLAHAPYIYNPCSKDEKIREYTAEAMGEELRFLENIPGAMYNFHPGCHVGQGVGTGIKYISDMLSRIMWRGMGTKVLLETMAGKGTELGRNFEELAAIIDAVDPSVRDSVGVCLDTCHVHDGGYPIAEDPSGVLAQFDRVIGLDRLCAVHMNDSMNPMGAKKDRHAKIGEGYIPTEAMAKLINHPALKDVPFYLETPCDLDGYAEEIALLKSLRREA